MGQTQSQSPLETGTAPSLPTTTSVNSAIRVPEEIETKITAGGSGVESLKNQPTEVGIPTDDGITSSPSNPHPTPNLGQLGTSELTPSHRQSVMDPKRNTTFMQRLKGRPKDKKVPKRDSTGDAYDGSLPSPRTPTLSAAQKDQEASTLHAAEKGKQPERVSDRDILPSSSTLRAQHVAPSTSLSHVSPIPSNPSFIPPSSHTMKNPQTAPGHIETEEIRRRIALLSGTPIRHPSGEDHDSGSSSSPVEPITPPSPNPLEQDPAFLDSPLSSPTSMAFPRSPSSDSVSRGLHPDVMNGVYHALENPGGGSWIDYPMDELYGDALQGNSSTIKDGRNIANASGQNDSPIIPVSNVLDGTTSDFDSAPTSRRRQPISARVAPLNLPSSRIPTSSQYLSSRNPRHEDSRPSPTLPSPRRSTYGLHDNRHNHPYSSGRSPSTQTSPVQQNFTPSTTDGQAMLVPSLPIIPAGTTMIVQGVVQTADGPPPSPTNATSTNNNASTTPSTSSQPEQPTPRVRTNSTAEPPRRERRRSFFDRRRHSSFVPGGDADPMPSLLGTGLGNTGVGGATSLSNGLDTPAGAADLLGALLVAAASATANMLLSDPGEGGSNGNTNGVGAGTTGAQPDLARMLDGVAQSVAGGMQRNIITHQGGAGSDGQSPSPRPRSGFNTWRDRFRRNSALDTEDVDEDNLFMRPARRPEDLFPNTATSTNPRSNGGGSGSTSEDPIEALRERIASELMRALARDSDGNMRNTGSPATSVTPTAVSPPPLPPRSTPTPPPPSRLPQLPVAPASPSSSLPCLVPVTDLEYGEPRTTESVGGPSNTNRVPEPELAPPPPVTTPLPDLPAEGSFDRFLHDTSADLRSTLLERMNRRNQPIAIPLPSLDTSALSSGTGESNSGVAGSSTTPNLTTQVVTRPAEGIIEPRLNWWRMYQFPPRTVQGSAGDVPGANNTTSTPTANPLIPDPAATSPTSPIAPANSSILIPVIVVGIRTAPSVMVQDIANLTMPQQAPATPTRPSTPRSNIASRIARPLSALIGSGPSPTQTPTASSASANTSTPVSTPPTTTPPTPVSTSSQVPEPTRSRTWSSRAARMFTRTFAPRRDRTRGSSQMTEAEVPAPAPVENSIDLAEDTPSPPPVLTEEPVSMTPADVTPPPPAVDAAANDATRDRTRNYLIWVIGGYYPSNHPILTSPGLLLNQFDQEDFWGLAELLGQVKTHVASKSDIERAGLEIMKAKFLKQYVKEGKISPNTADRCAICLDDYEEEQDLRVLSCKHIFHVDCVDKWFTEGSNNCPACRTKGVEIDENTSNVASGSNSSSPPTASSSRSP